MIRKTGKISRFINMLKDSAGIAQLPLMIGLLIMAVAVPIATKLVQTNTENRSKAVLPNDESAPGHWTGTTTTTTNNQSEDEKKHCNAYWKCSFGQCVGYAAYDTDASTCYSGFGSEAECASNCIQPTTPPPQPTSKLPGCIASCDVDCKNAGNQSGSCDANGNCTCNPFPTNVPTSAQANVSNCRADQAGKCGSAGGCGTNEMCTAQQNGTFRCTQDIAGACSAVAACNSITVGGCGSNYGCSTGQKCVKRTDVYSGYECVNDTSCPQALPMPTGTCTINSIACIDTQNYAMCGNGTWTGQGTCQYGMFCDSVTNKCKANPAPTVGAGCTYAGQSIPSGEERCYDVFWGLGGSDFVKCGSNGIATVVAHSSSSCGNSSKKCCKDEYNFYEFQYGNTCKSGYTQVDDSKCGGVTPTSGNCLSNGSTTTDAGKCCSKNAAYDGGSLLCKAVSTSITPTKAVSPTSSNCKASGAVVTSGGQCCSGSASYKDSQLTCTDCKGIGSVVSSGGDCCSKNAAYKDSQLTCVQPVTPTSSAAVPTSTGSVIANTYGCGGAVSQYLGGTCNELYGKSCEAGRLTTVRLVGSYPNRTCWLDCDTTCVGGGGGTTSAVPTSSYGGGGGGNGGSSAVPTSRPSCNGAPQPDDVCAADRLKVKPQCLNGGWDYDEQLCNADQRIETCGGILYCCPTNGGSWTTDTTKCPGAMKCTQCPDHPDWKKNGDANCDGKTDINDIAAWRSDFVGGDLGTTVKKDWRADFNCDGVVDINDASLWRQKFILTL